MKKEPFSFHEGDTCGLAQNDAVMRNRHIPDNSIFGYMTTFSGSTFAWNKKGQRFETKKGAYAHTVEFYCDDLKPIYGSHKNYYIHVWDEVHSRWRDYVCTAQSPMYYDIVYMIDWAKEHYGLGFGDTKTKPYAGKFPTTANTKRKHGGFQRDICGNNSITDYSCSDKLGYADWRHGNDARMI